MSQDPDRNAMLREEMVKLARQKPRYGYRRLHAMLERRGANDGQPLNVKRIYRLYLEEGLSVRRKKRKRLVRERAAEPRLTGPNQEWAIACSRTRVMHLDPLLKSASSAMQWRVYASTTVRMRTIRQKINPVHTAITRHLPRNLLCGRNVAVKASGNCSNQ